MKNVLKLCLVTNMTSHPISQYKSLIEHAVRGGVTMVQIREKSTNLAEVKARAQELQKILRPFGVPLIINDFIELAAEIDAGGVHIGQQDMHPDEARKILGPNKIIGLSIESLEELEHSNRLSTINYVTASAVFPSKTKPECKKIWGIEGLKQTILNSRHPVTAIGGIKLHNVRDIIEAGAQGIAVIGAIHDAKDPYRAALNLRNVLDGVDINRNGQGRNA